VCVTAHTSTEVECVAAPLCGSVYTFTSAASCMHVLSLARTLVLFRPSSRARTHSRAGLSCILVSLAAQASAFFWWLVRDHLFILADRLVSFFTSRTTDCLLLPVATGDCVFFWCQRVYSFACRQADLFDSHVLSPTPLPSFRPLRTL